MDVKKKRILFISIFSVVLLILIISYLNQSESYKKLPEIRVYSVKKTDIAEVIQANGQIQMDKETLIDPGMDGFVEKVYVVEGQKVEEGDPLIKVKNSDTLISLYKEFVTTQNNLKTTEDKYKSYETLYKNKAVSKVEYENIKSEYENLIFILKTTKERIKLMELKGVKFPEKITLTTPSDVVIEAPSSGTVMQIAYKDGEFLSPAKAILKIVDMETPIAVLDCDEIDVNKIKVGQNVVIKSDALGEEEIPGIVYQVGTVSLIKNGISSIEVKVKLTDTKGLFLRPGLTCDGKVLVVEKDNVFVAPLEAIYEEINKMITNKSIVNDTDHNFQVERQRFVLVVEQFGNETYKDFLVGEVKKKIVTTGISNDREIEIPEGLEENDLIIIFSEKVVTAGDKVLYKIPENLEKEE
ncbi:MAG: efflux RND transporter periplasmic adaptor subunit [bacterium]|nr:efflux RND transporter periplasmic adaptor subunit [bacterium]